MRDAHIIAARRTPVMARNGAFSALDVHALAAPVMLALLQDTGLAPDEVGEVVLSNALGAGGNPARIAALSAGLPLSVAGLSIDRQCAGGLDALLIARAMVQSGQHRIVLAGGAESYSRRPLRSRTFADGRPPEPYDQAPFTPWADRDPDMAQAAANLAQKLGISRHEQDDWAVDSHAKARAAQHQQSQAEIVPVAGAQHDGFVRGLTPQLCARAPVVAGCITSANMAVAADGAAFCLVVSDDVVARVAKPSAKILSGVTVGDDPCLPGLAPIAAIKTSLEAAGIAPGDVAVAEIMEAFGVQAIACQRGANLPRDIINPGGGGLARGHPIGASGAVLAVRLFHELRKTGGTGVAAIASAGGLGSALVLRASD